MIWQPLVLLGLAGFLAGGTVSSYRRGSRRTAVVLGLISLFFLVGGVLWLIRG